MALEEIAELVELVTRIRRRMHMCPALRWQEDETLQYLEGLFLEVCNGKDIFRIRRKRGGTLVDIKFDSNFSWDAWRAEVDALPIQENTGLEFASTVEGVSQACGHDFSPAMAMGALWALSRDIVRPTHNIRLMLQRAEENPGAPPEPRSGGDILVNDDGALEGMDRVHILHILSTLPLGEFHSRQGPLMGCSDRMGIKFTATGGHVMEPHIGSNAMQMLQATMNYLDSFAARHTSPFEPLVIEPTSADFGDGQSTSNIRPADGSAWWAVRHMLDREGQTQLQVDLRVGIEQALSIFQESGVEINMVDGHPTTTNSDFPEVAEVLKSAGLAVVEGKPELGGDDAAYYLQKCRGSYWFLGAGGPDYAGHHTAKFDPNEKALIHGVQFWLAMASR